MKLARLNKDGLTSVIGGRRTSFMLKNDRPFQNIDRKRTRMRVPDLANPRRNLDDINRRLIARDSRVLLQQRLSLDCRLLLRTCRPITHNQNRSKRQGPAPAYCAAGHADRGDDESGAE